MDLARSKFAGCFGKVVAIDDFELSFSLKSLSNDAIKLQRSMEVPVYSRSSSGVHWAALLSSNGESPSLRSTRSAVELLPHGDQGQTLEVLVKVTPKNASIEDMAALAYEARVLALLERHPNIVGFVGFASSSLPHMLVTEPLLHGSLRLFLKAHRSSLREQDTLHICLGIASALAYLESLDLVYRALSLDSIGVGREATDVKLVDFGQSEANSSASSRLTCLSLMLFGSFAPMFGYCRKHCLNSLHTC
jgi:serine/threonine protein kinase